MQFQKGNRYSVGNEGGRPPHFKTPEAMEEKCAEYFTYCLGEWKEKVVMTRVDGKDVPQLDEFGDPLVLRKCIRPAETVTILGLTLYLGFTSRQSLFDNMKRGQEFSEVLLRAKAFVEMDYESRLANRDKAHGAQFALMNMGWSSFSKNGLVGKDGELVNPPKKQFMIINGNKIEF